MSHALQIRRCNGTLRAKHSLPSFLQPPPARRPIPIISNRESFRLEIDVTHTKQTIPPHSNRENKACFSRHHRSTYCPSLRISNRESFRLETNVTQTKQTTGPSSNREKEAVFQIPLTTRKVPANPKIPTTAPAFLLRLKTTPVHCFVALTANFNLTTSRLNGPSSARKRHSNPQEKTAKTPTLTPPNLFRVERTPAFCFLKVTANSTYTHVSGRPTQFRLIGPQYRRRPCRLFSAPKSQSRHKPRSRSAGVPAGSHEENQATTQRKRRTHLNQFQVQQVTLPNIDLQAPAA